MIRYRCPQCGALLQSPDDMAGQTDQCPTCGHQCVVSTKPPDTMAGPDSPDDSPQPGVPNHDADDRERSEHDSRPPPDALGPAAGRKPSPLLLLWGCVLAGLTLYALFIASPMSAPGAVASLDEFVPSRAIRTAPPGLRCLFAVGGLVGIGMCWVLHWLSTHRPQRSLILKIASGPLFMVATLIPTWALGDFVAGRVLQARGFTYAENGWCATVRSGTVHIDPFGGKGSFVIEPGGKSGGGRICVRLHPWRLDSTMASAVMAVSFLSCVRRFGAAGLLISSMSAFAFLALACFLRFSWRRREARQA